MQQTKKFKKGANIFLIGMMAAGKSTLGKTLAGLIGYQFIDLDEYIEQQTGVTINDIFALEQEQGFRKRETEALKQLALSNESVIATGGGAIVSAENRNILKKNYCLYLKTSIAAIINKTYLSNKRPLIANKTPEQMHLILSNLYEQRKKWYQKLATDQFDSENRNLQTAFSLKEIVKQRIDF